MFDLGEAAIRVSNTFNALPSFQGPAMGQFNVGPGPVNIGGALGQAPSMVGRAPSTPGMFNFQTAFSAPGMMGNAGIHNLGAPFQGMILNPDGSINKSQSPLFGGATGGNPLTAVGDALGGAISGAASKLTGGMNGAKQGVLNWMDQINTASQQYGVPADVIAAVMDEESSGNPTAQSPVGAKGLMQLMPGTAQELGVTDPFDPVQSINGGAKHLSQLYGLYKDWNKALVAYNAGSYNPSASYNGVSAGDYANQVQQLRNLYTTTPVNTLATGSGNDLADPNSGPKPQWVMDAESQLADITGKPYSWGGKDPSTGFDCSGFVSWVYGKQGIRLTPQTQSMYAETAPVQGPPQPGDLVFFNMNINDPHMQHVGIYLGNGQFINDTDYGGKSGVQIDPIAGYWQGQSPEFRRVQ